jgi:hypothetical protein
MSESTLPLPVAVAEGAVTAGELLRQAAALYDAPGSALRLSASRAARRGFASGAEWMGLALMTIRCQSPIPTPSWAYHRLGLVKYGLASGAALLWAGAAFAVGWPWLALPSLPIFYAVEAQFVFLFPLALDGCRIPWRESRRWTRAAGGTVAVMRVVLPLASTMLLGGLLGRGFVRSWCLGCLAVCIWYEGLRRTMSAEAP